MSDPELADEQLVQRFNQGDEAAFEELWNRYKTPLYNFILRSVRERERANELLQEAFLRVIQRAAEFRGQSKFSTWLYTIARNLCIDHSRKMVFRRHKSLDAPSRSGAEDEGPTMLERTAASSPGVDRAVIGEDLKARIAESVQALPEDQREVFLLRQVQGLPFRDISEIVGVPENTVKSRMRYALERLQRALAEYQDYVAELT